MDKLWFLSANLNHDEPVAPPVQRVLLDARHTASKQIADLENDHAG